MSNPLLNLSFDSLPSFSSVKAEHIGPALDAILKKNQHRLEYLLEQTAQYTWDNLVWPLEVLEAELEDMWSTVSHLNAVLNSPELHHAYQAALAKLSVYHTEIRQNKQLYQAFLSISQSAEYQSLNLAQQKIIQNALRDFSLSGINLPVDQQEQFKALSVRLSELESLFEQNVLEATNAWVLHIAETESEKLRGLPEDALAQAQERATQKEKTGWLLSLEYPSYHAVMTYAEDRTLRQTLYHASTTRASEHFPAGRQWDNGPIMVEIMQSRQALAKLLGFSDYAEYALSTRMLKKPAEVTNFLSDLSVHAKKAAIQNLEELKAFARDVCALESLEPWDVAFVSEKMVQRQYAISEEMLRQYFPEEIVLNGLFEIVQRLYGVVVKEVQDFDKWHPSVRLFEVYDADMHLRGRFFIDLYARPNKRGGAWISTGKARMKALAAQAEQLPMVYLVANFAAANAASETASSLFTHDEVLTLFHEFGHCLHYVLSTIDYPSISGGHGVSWDAIELPSQLLEYWAWEAEALDLISQHIHTKVALPKDVFQKLKDSKHFHSGLRLVRQLEFALFDFSLHSQPQISNPTEIQNILNTVRSQITLIPVPEFNRFQNGFSHVFGGSYAAGYYSYLWSEIMAADVYARFKENNKVFDKAVAQQFLENILEKGGSREFIDLFVAFRGRPPSIDALLKEYNFMEH